MSLAMLIGTVLALLVLGVPLWTGLLSLDRFGGGPTVDPYARVGRERIARLVGGDLCTLAGVLSSVCALSARGTLGSAAALVAFLLLLHAGLGLAYVRAQRVKRAWTMVLSRRP